MTSWHRTELASRNLELQVTRNSKRRIQQSGPNAAMRSSTSTHAAQVTAKGPLRTGVHRKPRTSMTLLIGWHASLGAMGLWLWLVTHGWLSHRSTLLVACDTLP